MFSSSLFSLNCSSSWVWVSVMFSQCGVRFSFITDLIKSQWSRESTRRESNFTASVPRSPPSPLLPLTHPERKQVWRKAVIGSHYPHTVWQTEGAADWDGSGQPLKTSFVHTDSTMMTVLMSFTEASFDLWWSGSLTQTHDALLTTVVHQPPLQRPWGWGEDLCAEMQ